MPYTNVMPQFAKGTLHSGSKKGPKVTNRKQAIAIMMSEKKKGPKYHASGSGAFSSSEIKQGYKVEYRANDLDKLAGQDDKVTGKMAKRVKPITRQG